MSEIDTNLFDAMGQRFGVVEIVGSLGREYVVSGDPDKYDKVIASNIKFSEAKAIVKLLGERDG